jgi:hypothetical protein
LRKNWVEQGLRAIWSYIARHWRGEQGLAWSFWVNFLALRIVIFLGQDALLPDEGKDYSTMPLVVLGLLILFHIVVFLWQIVGVLRAGEVFLKDTGSQAAVWGAQIALIAAFWLTASYSLAAWQTILPALEEENYLIRMDREHRSRYAITTVDNDTLLIDGLMELGITKALTKVLAPGHPYRTVILNSVGGNVYEARGLARLFRENGIATRVEDSCSSACTAAFIGGTKRSLGKGAKLGFHQYRIDANYSLVNVNPIEEQARDRALFEASNVSPWFLDRMFHRESHDMWYPHHTELIRAGVVNAVDD